MPVYAQLVVCCHVAKDKKNTLRIPEVESTDATGQRSISNMAPARKEAFPKEKLDFQHLFSILGSPSRFTTQKTRKPYKIFTAMEDCFLK